MLSLEELSTVSRRIAGDSKLSILRSANISLSSLGHQTPELVITAISMRASWRQIFPFWGLLCKQWAVSVVLADRRTIWDIGRVVNVELEFTDRHQVTHSSDVTLHVLDRCDYWFSWHSPQ